MTRKKNFRILVGLKTIYLAQGKVLVFGL
jgi:hypothetical protein